MRILIAPDSFKGTFSADEVARLIGDGVRSSGGTAVECPVADGGEGTGEILCRVSGGRMVEVGAVGPWRDPLHASYSLDDGGTAVIELAAASGITLSTAGPRDPIAADTFGTGMLVADAVRRGATDVVVAAGGSATTDGGAGAIEAIEAAGGVGAARVRVLTDVVTPFEDAARVFGPQKGASPQQVEQLSERLDRQARALPRDPRGVPGTGAAGGFSGGLWARFGAEIVPGADHVLDVLGFDALVAEADAVVVGEGRLDAQTGQGKIISAVLARAGVTPVLAVVGSVDPDLGDGAARFADVIVASDADALRAAGASLVAIARAVRIESSCAGRHTGGGAHQSTRSGPSASESR